MTLFAAAARSEYGDAVILLLAVGLLGLLFSLLALIGDCMDRRALRRDVYRAHQPRPFDHERDAS